MDEVITDKIEVDVSGLPSEQQRNSFSFDEADIINGKFAGRWESPKQMADHIKSIEDKYANLNREIANSEKQSKQVDETIQAQKIKEDTIKSLVPEFLSNGMTVTDDMKSKLLKTGISEQEIKLGAYELKEAIDKNASYVGGMENYKIIMEYHAENMSEAEKLAFNHSIQDPKNSKALMIGLQTIYEKEASQQPDRFKGQPSSNNSIKPYTSKRELLADKAYADSRASSASDKARFKSRLSITPDNVWLS